MEPKPFKFCTSSELVLLTGKRASTLKELLDGLKTLSGLCSLLPYPSFSYTAPVFIA